MILLILSSRHDFMGRGRNSKLLIRIGAVCWLTLGTGVFWCQTTFAEQLFIELEPNDSPREVNPVA